MTIKAKKILFFTFALFLININCQNHEENSESTDHPQNFRTLNESQIWGFGFLAGFGISAIGFLTALVIVFCKHMASDSCFQMTIKFLFSLSFGALLGDAMIHILPEAYTIEGSDPRVVAAVFILSIVFFLILERLFAACGITHQHWHSNDCHDDHQGAIQHHNHPNKVQNQQASQSNQHNLKVTPIISTNMMIDQISQGHKCKHNHSDNHKHSKQQKISQVHGSQHCHSHNQSQNQANNPQHSKQCQEEKSCLQNLKGKGSAGYMNLLGSFIHNFMDGLALGVAFATGDPKSFVPILVAIIAHQIPREMGDVAILMTNKFNGAQTVLCNGIVNLTSLVGVFIGLAVASVHQVTKQYILVFVAGNFIFIAADIWRHLFKNSGFAKNLLQFFGFAIGVGSMYLILLLQSNQKGHQ